MTSLPEWAALAPTHPSLTWQVNGVLVAHRHSGTDGETACERKGTLTVAERGLPLCPKCFRS